MGDVGDVGDFENGHFEFWMRNHSHTHSPTPLGGILGWGSGCVTQCDSRVTLGIYTSDPHHPHHPFS